MMKYILAIQIFSLHYILCQSQKDDFFPLDIGNSWTYDYSNRSTTLGGTVYLDRDSGSAVYKVVSKILTVDSTVWQIVEIRDLIHWWAKLGPGPQGGGKYYIKDTTLLSIIEYHQGNHRLIRHGSGNWKSVFNMTSEYSDSISLFRYQPFTLQDTTIFITNSTINYCSTTYKRGVGIIKSVLNNSSALIETNHSLLSSFVTSVSPANSISYPNEFNVKHNYPNPFNPITVISFDVRSEMNIKINIYDLLGRCIETLYNNDISIGSHSIVWNAINIPSGVYYCVFQSTGFSKTIKLVLEK